MFHAQMGCRTAQGRYEYAVSGLRVCVVFLYTWNLLRVGLRLTEARVFQTDDGVWIMHIVTCFLAGMSIYFVRVCLILSTVGLI